MDNDGAFKHTGGEEDVEEMPRKRLPSLCSIVNSEVGVS
jgi:hypothetical protein